MADSRLTKPFSKIFEQVVKPVTDIADAHLELLGSRHGALVFREDGSWLHRRAHGLRVLHLILVQEIGGETVQAKLHCAVVEASNGHSQVLA